MGRPREAKEFEKAHAEEPAATRTPLTRTPPPYPHAIGLNECTVQARHRVLDDGSVLLFLRLVGHCAGDDWENGKQEVLRFLTYVEENHVCFQLLIEVDHRSGLTLEQIIDMTKVIRTKKSAVVSSLKGTIVLVHSPTIEMLLNASVSIIRPLKPFMVTCLTPEDVDAGKEEEWFLSRSIFRGVKKDFKSLPWPDADSPRA